MLFIVICVRQSLTGKVPTYTEKSQYPIFFHSSPFVPLGSYSTILVNGEEKHYWVVGIS